jgi:hypothetical protein
MVGRKLPASAVNNILSDNVTQEMGKELFVSVLLDIH